MVPYLAILLLLLNLAASAQESIPGTGITCYGTRTSGHGRTIPANSALRSQGNLSSFEITYESFPEEAKGAFRYAIGIWQKVLASPVPIRVKATWTSLDGGALASTGATRLYRNFPGAARRDAWYPVSLAERLEGRALNADADADIVLSVNRDVDWYVGTDGRPPSYQTDLVSVILHEIAHGLGFISSASQQGGEGRLGDRDYPLIYDLLLEGDRNVPFSSLPNPSADLYGQFTSGTVYLRSPTAAKRNHDRLPKVYAPLPFDRNSSLSHLDESTFPEGDSNSLMTPAFGTAESIHVPGEALLGILADLGWQAEEEGPTRLAIVPNPGTGAFNLQTSLGDDDMEVSVVDATGRRVRRPDEAGFREAGGRINLSGLPVGVYVLLISTRERVFVRRVCLVK